MTIKHYLNKPMMKEFTSRILWTGVHEDYPDQYLIELDQTAFYPEGGGQPSDQGTIGESQVSYVYEEKGVVYHVVDRLPNQRENLACRIDWDRRKDHMQQHLGQHLLSALFEKELHATTIGFHLGKELVTIDLDLPALSSEQSNLIEYQVNDLISENPQVTFHYPTAAELKNFSLRTQPTVEENIRIVEIEGIDFSPCGGTHFPTIGSIGLMKIVNWEKLRKGIRVEFLCGQRACLDYQWKNDTINQLARDMSLRDRDLLKGVENLLSSHKSLTKAFQQQKIALLEYEAQKLYDQAQIFKTYRLITEIFTDKDMKEIQSLANLLNQKEGVIALLAISHERAQVIFTRSPEIKADMNQLLKEVMPLIDGKGGGSPSTAQGGGSLIGNLAGLLEASVNKLKREYLK